MERGNNDRPRRITSGLSKAELFLGAAAAAPEPVNSNGGIELDETDVVWAGDFEEEGSKDKDKEKHPMQTPPQSQPRILMSSPASSKENGRRSQRRGIEHATSGLSAALDNGRRGLGRSSLVSNKPLTGVANFSPTRARTIIPSAAVTSKGPVEDYSSSARKYHQSAPVNVPTWMKTNNSSPKPGLGKLQGGPDDVLAEVDDDGDDKDDERLPPHEILARDYARSHMTTFSVYEGLGRTLRGRDLRRVRNAVWRQTGFLD